MGRQSTQVANPDELAKQLKAQEDELSERQVPRKVELITSLFCLLHPTYYYRFNLYCREGDIIGGLVEEGNSGKDVRRFVCFRGCPECSTE